jgi:hypothetical protein
MELRISITVPFFGLSLAVEIDGTYTHETFEPDAVFLDSLTDHADSDHAGPVSQRVKMFLPTPADVSDFYSAHAEAIDAAVKAELADHAEAAADTYEAQRQDEIDDNAERARS